MIECKNCWVRKCHVYVEGDRLEGITAANHEGSINRCSSVKVIHVSKDTERDYAHLHFESFTQSSKFFYLFGALSRIICIKAPAMQVKPAFAKTSPISYRSVAVGEEVPRVCNYQRWAPAITPSTSTAMGTATTRPSHRHTHLHTHSRRACVEIHPEEIN
ncbi:hypothetical protein V8B55DRAFT_1451546 [Mucor lusitanicus]|uniref:Uncharacterized protein n=1 Tax=Mucor lusitanicus CBS 277.49 TaxID=747725 RepID=A0A162TRE6_MUCCL|nr:hypothetical protein MUCCIDRAFT_183044 [Mucor lusitanicus CBS 277.49]